jgi:anti-sigma factor RsiW
MSCHEIGREISLYCYGEVSSEVEERVEAHLAECSDCRHELARHRAFLELIDQREDVTDASLLSVCRVGLRNALHEDAKPAHQRWLESLRSFAHFDIPFRIPVGAMALIALGFFGARFTPARFGGVQAGLAEPMFSSVRSVEPEASGKVQIAVDEVRRHVVTGTLQDPAIQGLLLTAVREESNPGVRVESIGVLQNGGDSAEVRKALTDALTHDPSAAVRLKALEGLKSYAGDPSVRKTLADVLLKDDDPGVRVQAIDLLTAHHDDSIVGVLQDVVQKEDNSYVRTRTTQLLEEMKASVGTY